MNIPIDICIFYKHYLVCAKFGHVGKGYYIPKKVPLIANNKKAAARKVKNMPRVKKNIKDNIFEVQEISHEEYMKALKEYKGDKYFKCHNIQQQNRLYPDWKFQRKNIKDNHNKRNLHSYDESWLDKEF